MFSMREDVESELDEDEITEAFLLRSASESGKEGSADGWATSTRIIQPKDSDQVDGYCDEDNVVRNQWETAMSC